MELQQLKYFKAVAEAGKLSDAAQNLYISSPALSASISRLEKDLGYRLFDRTNSSIRLNRQGHIFLKYVNEIFSAINSAKDELHQSMLEESSHIGVGCISSTSWVDLIAAFSQKHPDIALSCAEMTPEELAANTLSSKHAFLLGSENIIPKRLADSMDSIALFEDDILIAVPRKHPLSCRQQISIHELQEENLLLPMPAYPLYHNLSQLFDSCGISLPENNAYSYLMAVHMASKGSGIAFSTTHMKNIVDLPLVYIPVSDPHPHWTCRLYWQKDKIFSSEHKIFQKFTEDYYNAG